MREFKHLTADQRYQICALRKERKSYAFIANQIGVAKSTVSREIQNNSGQRGYRPKQAQEFADARKANASQVGRNTKKFAPQDRQLVETMIRLDLSPQHISGRLRLEGRLNISHETLYKWIYADKKRGGDLHGHLRCPKTYRKRYASGFDRRGSMPGRVGIESRPAIVEEKSHIGDWEGDTIIGKNHKGAIVTLADRHSRFVMAAHVERKTAEEVAAAMVFMLSACQGKVHTLTLDNGKEFSNHAELSKTLGISVYFARPYHSWESGLNENSNGLLRQYFPKSQELASVDPAELVDALCRMNHRPREILGFRTPFEVFFGVTIDYVENVSVAFQT